MARLHPANPRTSLRYRAAASVRLGFSLIALLTFASSLPAQTTTYSWDANGGGAGGGGTGNWSTGASATNWTSDGVAFVVWTSIADQANAVASFAGTAGTVTLNASFLTHSLEFSSSGYTLDSTVGRVITNSSGNVTVASGSAVTIGESVRLGGTSGFTKLGAGTLILATTNSYTGTAAISAGTVIYATNQALRNSSLVVEAGATLDLAGFAHIISATGATLFGSGAITGNAGSALAYNSTTDSDFSGVLSGDPSLSKSGGASSTLTLSGSSANTYTGDTFVSLGNLTLNKTAGVIAVPGNLIIGDGSGTDTVSLSAANQIADTSVVTMASSGRFNLNGNAETIGALVGSVSGATINLGGGALTIAGSSASSFVGNITNVNGVLTVGGANNANLSGIISGTGGSVVKTGSGTLTLAGANTYSGATTMAGGTLRVDGNAQLGNTNTTLTISNAGILEVTAAGALSNSITIGAGNGVLTNSSAGALIIAGNVDKNGTVFTSRSGSGTNVFTGVISGASANSDFIVDGGTTVFSNVMTYNGPTIITNGGTLVLGVDNAMPSGSDLILGGGTFRVGVLNYNAASTLLIGTLTLTENSMIDLGDFGTSGDRNLVFADSSGVAINWATNAVLTISNWQGVAQTQSDVTKLLFGTGGLDSDQLAQIQFAGYDQGGALLGAAGELAPIPEAPVVWGAAAVTAFIFWRERRRLLALFIRRRG